MRPADVEKVPPTIKVRIGPSKFLAADEATFLIGRYKFKAELAPEGWIIRQSRRGTDDKTQRAAYALAFEGASFSSVEACATAIQEVTPCE